MTKEELSKRLEELADQYDKDKENIFIQYAKENCDVKIGDIITDHSHTIKVERMRIYYDFGTKIPMMVFEEPDYKKDGTINKRQTNIPVYQSNIKFVNGKEYNYKR